MSITSTPRERLNPVLAEAALPAQGQPRAWRVADVSVLALWVVTVGFTLRHHEKWADEAQGWLLARDLNLSSLWFRELRYEGSPGLWHSILWLAQHLFHVPYSGLGVLGMLWAFAGVVLLVLWAPFPRPVRWLLASSYYLLYQYAVIARPYVLLPLFGFAAALFYKDKEHPERIAITLILLANVSVHGTLLAAVIGFVYLINGIRNFPRLEDRVRGRYVLSIAAVVLAFLFLYVILKPPADVEAMQEVQDKTRAAIASSTWHGLAGAFFDSTPITALWLALLAAWCWLRRGVSALVLPLSLVAMAVFYGFYGWVHHQGTIFVAAITALWIMWPTPQEQQSFSSWGRWTHRALIAGLVCLLGYQTWMAGAVIRNDYRYPYSGAEDAAKFLKGVGADHQPVIGYLYGMVGIEAYFDHNIQSNRPTAYFHHGYPFPGVQLDGAEIDRLAPAYVVLPSWFDPEGDFRNVFEPFMRDHGYSLVHFSDGYLFAKGGWDVRQVYFIYKRD